MADDAATTTEAVETTSTETATETSATEALGDGGKKALDAERRERRAAEKRASDFEARLKEFEDRDKTEAEKLAERATAAEKRAAELETSALRLEVAAEKGLTPTQAKRLVGATREELEADADELLSTFKPAESNETETVIASLDLGSRGTATAAGNPAADFAKFLGGQMNRR